MLIANQLPPTKLLTAWDRDKAGKVDNALRKRNYLQRMKGLCDFGDGVDLELWDHRVHAGHLSLARAGHPLPALLTNSASPPSTPCQLSRSRPVPYPPRLPPPHHFAPRVRCVTRLWRSSTRWPQKPTTWSRSRTFPSSSTGIGPPNGPTSSDMRQRLPTRLGGLQQQHPPCWIP